MLHRSAMCSVPDGAASAQLAWRTIGEMNAINTSAEPGRAPRPSLVPSIGSVCATFARDASRVAIFDLNTGTGWSN
jgi:hypothetical protein